MLICCLFVIVFVNLRVYFSDFMRKVDLGKVCEDCYVVNHIISAVFHF